MSAVTTPTKTAGKARATNKASTTSPSANSAGVNDDIIPLLLATTNNATINYKQIAALDPQQRTASSFEHKFRKWKARAKELLDGVANGGADHGNQNGGNGNVPATKRKTVNDAAHNESGDGEEGPTKKPKVTEQAPSKINGGTDLEAKIGTMSKAPTQDVTLDDNKAIVIRRTTARKAPVKVKTPVFVDESDIKDEGETSEAEWQAPHIEKSVDGMANLSNVSPIKKARVLKKGTARIVKKKLGMRGAGGASDGEEYNGASDEIEVEFNGAKTKAKRGKNTGGAKPAAKSAGKGKGKGKAVMENEDTKMKNEDSLTEQEDVEMQFE